MLTYYGIAAEDCQKTLQATAETLGMTVKQVRSRLEKGRKIIKEMYSNTVITAILRHNSYKNRKY